MELDLPRAARESEAQAFVKVSDSLQEGTGGYLIPSGEGRRSTRGLKCRGYASPDAAVYRNHVVLTKFLRHQYPLTTYQNQGAVGSENHGDATKLMDCEMEGGGLGDAKKRATSPTT